MTGGDGEDGVPRCHRAQALRTPCGGRGGGAPRGDKPQKGARRRNDPQPHSTNNALPRAPRARRTPPPQAPPPPPSHTQERAPPRCTVHPLPIQHPFPGLHPLPTPSAPIGPTPPRRSPPKSRRPPPLRCPPPQAAPTSGPPLSAPSAAPCPRNAPPSPSSPRPPPRADWLSEGERRVLCLSPISDWFEAEG